MLFEIDSSKDVLFVIGENDKLARLKELVPLIKKMLGKVWLLVVKNDDHYLTVDPAIATKPVGEMVGRIVAE